MTVPPVTRRAGEAPQAVTREFELFDPQLEAPPIGVDLLLINPGGVLIIGPWRKDAGYLAWGPKPSIPASVKARVRGAV